MNVLFLQPALPLYRVPFFERLQQDGWNVSVWSDHSSPLHAGQSGLSFDTAHHRERHWAGLVAQPALLDAVRQSWADVVVLSWNVRYLHLLPALLEARIQRKPVVLWGHGYSKNERPLRRRWRNRLGKMATACVTYSEGARLRLIGEGFAPNRTYCAPNALHDVPLHCPALELSSDVGSQAFAEATRAVGEPVVLFSSRLEADKKPQLLIDAFALVRQEVPNARLVMIGAGSQTTALQRRIQHLGLTDAISLAGAIYDEPTLSPLFSQATVFAYPTAIGLSLLHAFSYGLPVVTSQAAERHNPEFDVLVPNVNGLTYTDGEVSDFARQIVRVLRDPTLRARLSAGALAAVSAPHGRTLGAMVHGMRAAIEYAAHSCPRRAE
jgi:glycosyltransferase involved in cell wall biosynthesis